VPVGTSAVTASGAEHKRWHGSLPAALGERRRPLVGRKASFRMLTLYDMDRMTEQRAGAFLDRLEQAFLRF
jgi:hypothetical protein